MTQLGRLVIAWGPVAGSPEQIRAFVEGIFEGREPGPGQLVDRFHQDPLDDDPDPFASRRFGAVVRTLLDGRNVLVTDRSFEDPERRDLVAEAFRRTLPGLLVDQVTMGGGAPPAEPAPNPHPHPHPHPGIVIDADVYGDAEWSSHERIVVTADAPREVLVAALEEAAYRMTFVGDNGRVYEDVVDAEMEDVYTADWFSEVKVDERGDAGFYIDCNGAIEDPMAARFKEILVEELVRAGIERAHVRVP